MTRYPNPDHISIGIEGPNVESASEYSRRELAQRSKIFDTKEGKFRNESVNDLSLFENPFQYNNFPTLRLLPNLGICRRSSPA